MVGRRAGGWTPRPATPTSEIALDSLISSDLSVCLSATFLFDCVYISPPSGLPDCCVGHDTDYGNRQTCRKFEALGIEAVGLLG